MKIKELIKRKKKEKTEVLYECDRKRCKCCHEGICHLTTDIEHAANFERVKGFYIEKTANMVIDK